MSWAEVKKVNSDLNIPLNEKINSLQGLIEAGVTCVKRVQRGVLTTSGAKDHTVSISSVTVNKAIVILNGYGVSTVSYGPQNYYIKSMSSTSFIINVKNFDSDNPGSIGWQVIEFY